MVNGSFALVHQRVFDVNTVQQKNNNEPHHEKTGFLNIRS